MKILQITDLHFGKHNEALAQTLPAWVEQIRPDVIVATGDLVDTPRADLFQQALAFLKSLEPLCVPVDVSANSNRPQILVIPGNHDLWYRGVLPMLRTPVHLRPAWVRTSYRETFAAFHSQYYFGPENVWIYGFDSARKKAFATGQVLEEDIADFHIEYDRLSKTHPEFKKAFKIAVVHHHPLPVNWQTDWKQQLLTMINAGSFLSSMLNKGIDLVLHGHEHLQARARLSSSLGGEGDNELTVVSLGATLRKVNNPDRNWLNLIVVEPNQPITITSYEGKDSFFETEGETYEIRSFESVAADVFHQSKQKAGYVYSEVASISLLTVDGDCRRVVECEELEILDGASPRAKGHQLTIPPTSGFLGGLKAEAIANSPYPGLHLTKKQTQGPPPVITATIRYGNHVELRKGDQISYRYQWWAYSSFAMNGPQFRKKYPDDPAFMEFTHYPVVDPIKELTIILQVPKEFESRPYVRVTEMDLSKTDNRGWNRRTDLEKKLRDSHALRYVESLGIASLRVTKPLQGCCYGIEWRVPKEDETPINRYVEEVHQRVLAALDAGKGRDFLRLAANVSQMTRQVLLKGWRGPIWISLMVWDGRSGQLRVVTAAKTDDFRVRPWNLPLTLRYGEGIAGRAFKSNGVRLYQNRPDGPGVFTVLEGQPVDEVLLSVPLRSPKLRFPDSDYSQHVYGAVSLSSPDPRCPLARLEAEEEIAGEQRVVATEDVDDWLEAINDGVLTALDSITKEIGFPS